jgi:hypothetical protein
MPVIVKMDYADGSSETINIPAEIWRQNPESVSKVLITDKEVLAFVLDPNEETADIDISNNAFPRVEESSSKFDEMKKKSEGEK